MVRRHVRRSIALAAAAALLFSGVVLADSVAADGDVASGVQTLVDLGTVGPGATVSRDVGMTLLCNGTRHVDPGQVVNLWQADVTVPAAGGSIAATSTTVGPVPPAWANDTAGLSGCSGPMHVDATVPSHVAIVAPSTPGLDYAFSVTYGRTLSPAGVSDGSSVTGLTIVTFVLDVEDGDTTPPTLTGVPADLDLVTGDPAGAILDYPVPAAKDDRDPVPTVACDPAPGTLIPVGSTTVTCTATDTTGNHASASFQAVVHLAVVAWESPVASGGDVAATRGRALPVKARAWFDGEVREGAADLVVTGCDPSSTAFAAPERSISMERQAEAGRWMTVLDTSGLVAGCHRLGLTMDGRLLGSFTLAITEPPTATPGAAKRGSQPS